jgi:hypothetical protein
VTGSARTNRPMFFLIEGGPTYRLEQRAGLVREHSPLIVRRALFSILLTWVPLLVLSALQDNAIGDRVAIPFLRDFASYTRFLFALPLLLVAESVLGPQIARAAAHFVHSGLVIEEDYGRFDSAVEKGLRWRDSALAEFLLLALAYCVAYTTLNSLAVQSSTWYVTHTGATHSLTMAGRWFAFFCVPFMQFILLRWLWRMFLWGQFLWRMSKLNLQLIPTHPDEAGGLGFSGEAHRFFSVILFAYSVGAAGVLANNIVYDKIPLSHFAPLIGAYVIVAVLIFLLPLCVFTPILVQTKRTGLYKYGSLATEYTSSFQKKWIETQPPREEALLGSGDIQSLADLGNSFSFIEKMGILPTDHRTPIAFAAACLIPMMPLLLTMMPLGELLGMLLKLVL